MGGGDSTSWLWGFKSVEGVGPNAYPHALFAEFDLAGRSERRGESVDQADHDRVRGLTVIGVRGGLAVREPRVAVLRGWLWCSACWLVWCSGTVCTVPVA